MAVDLVTAAVTKILDGIVEGQFVEERPLPPEAELARFLDVSRPTMREAVRTLSLGGVLNVVHGRGTFLLPRFRWHELRYLMYVASREGRALEIEVEVLGVESMLEIGSVRLAALKRTEADVEALRQCLEDVRVADRLGDVQAVVGSSNAFHDILLAATGNQFIASAVHPYRDALLSARFRTAESPQVRQRIMTSLEQILDAVDRRDPERAAEAMRTHMGRMREEIAAARPRRTDERVDIP
ncbi:FadR/GntR family transcriptional regulator [Actinomyces sp.]|uniref:FadR/GntR family transcriptional regulator n=1 Tax=Actinomyces sp. TaxID=29317 RepID=UPI0026DBEC4A|nr:FCD domain-containing protein [Actinomyces sp.]MDO4901929.1 FCD domain-containing protein [Actinomyces sp.]